MKNHRDKNYHGYPHDGLITSRWHSGTNIVFVKLYASFLENLVSLNLFVPPLIQVSSDNFVQW